MTEETRRRFIAKYGDDVEIRRSETGVVATTKGLLDEKSGYISFPLGTEIQTGDEVFFVVREEVYPIEQVRKEVLRGKALALQAYYYPLWNSHSRTVVNHGTVLNVGSISGSAFQIASPGATQTVTVMGGGVDQQAMTREAIKIVLEVLKELNLTDEEKEEVKTDAECAQKQLDSPKTKWQMVKEFLGGIRKKVEAGIQKVASAAIVARAEEAVKYLDEVLPHLGQQ